MRVTEKYVFFYGNADHMSNFHPSPFEADGHQFSCCEQYIMWRKAVVFGDVDIAEQILSAKKPQVMKALGRKVRNFDDNVWYSVRGEVALDAVLHKYSQNDDLRSLLLATGSRHIVEASPSDRIWGVGLGENDRRIDDPQNWRGQNILGEALMAARSVLQAQQVEPVVVTS